MKASFRVYSVPVMCASRTTFALHSPSIQANNELEDHEIKREHPKLGYKQNESGRSLVDVAVFEVLRVEFVRLRDQLLLHGVARRKVAEMTGPHAREHMLEVTSLCG